MSITLHFHSDVPWTSQLTGPLSTVLSTYHHCTPFYEQTE